MTVLLIIVLVLIILLLLSLVKIPIALKLYVNPLKNKNFVYVKIAFFVVFCALVQTEENKITLTNTKGEIKVLKLKPLTKFQKHFFIALAKKMDFGQTFVVVKGGVKDDAFKTALLVGAVNSFLNNLKIYLKNKFNVIINFVSYTNYKQDELTVGADLNIKICFMDVALAFLKSIFKVRRNTNGQRKKSYSKHFN